jgi:hypothetical protein
LWRSHVKQTHCPTRNFVQQVLTRGKGKMAFNSHDHQGQRSRHARAGRRGRRGPPRGHQCRRRPPSLSVLFHDEDLAPKQQECVQFAWDTDKKAWSVTSAEHNLENKAAARLQARQRPRQ